MLDRELCSEVLKRALSRGGEYADIFVEKKRVTALVIDDGKIGKIVSGIDSGAGIRLIVDGRTSYLSTNDLSASALREAASQLSLAGSGSAGEPRSLGTPLTSEAAGADGVSGLSMAGKIDLLRAADRAARQAGEGIAQVTATYRDSVQNVLIAASDGSFAEDVRTHVSGSINVVAVRGPEIQTGYETIGGGTGTPAFTREDMQGTALKAAARALMMLGARKAPGGRMPVVIASSAGGTMIHEAIGHGLEADLARQNLSVFAGKIGAKVASSLITVIDDATLQGRRGSFTVDDEGVPARRTVLVRNGVLEGYLTDRLTAMKHGGPLTGNGRRESYRNRPISRMSNTFIQSGDTDPAAIVASLDRGLLVVKMGGGQVNTVTGDFVFDVQEAYLIERGLRGEPVRGATLTGNGPQVLEAIDMVGSDLGFSIGTCGKDAQGVPVSDAMPTVRIPEMVVGGAY